MFSLHSPVASMVYSKSFLFPGIFTAPWCSACELPTSNSCLQALHSYVLAYISLCLFKLVNTNSGLPGSLWAALQSSSGVCYFLCLFIGTFIQPLPQKPWNHIEHRVIPLYTDPTSTARETSLNFNPSQKTLLLLDTFCLLPAEECASMIKTFGLCILPSTYRLVFVTIMCEVRFSSRKKEKSLLALNVAMKLSRQRI